MMVKKKFKGIIFDLDGTLLNTLSNLAYSYNSVLAELGFPSHPTEAYKVFVGDGARQCMTRCLPRNSSVTLIETALDLQQRHYENNWQQGVPVYDGIMPLLNELESQEIKLAVLSNKDHRFTEKCVDFFFPEVNFSVVQGFDVGIPHKPDPKGAILIADKLQLDVSEIAFIGDTKMDISTARASGMFAIGVLWGFREKEELVSAKADRIVARPADLTGILF